MESNSTQPKEVVLPVHISKKKIYPFDPEDVEREKEIKDAIKKSDPREKLQLIALNNLTLMKKQQAVNQDIETKIIVNSYNQFQEPITKATNQIVEGARVLNGPEINSLKIFLTEEEVSKINDANKEEPIPEYWYTAMINCPPISSFIEEHDHHLLKHVIRIEYKTEDETDNFTVIFHFSPNEYFENPFLSVKFNMIDEGEAEGSQATEIKWKEGKNITKKTVIKKQKNKKSGNIREVKKEIETDSFFNFFKTIDIEETTENADEDEAVDLAGQLDLNFELAHKIESELLPYHLEYYLGIREPDPDDDIKGRYSEDEGDEGEPKK